MVCLRTLSLKTCFLLGAVTLILSSCGWKWPEVESWERDPLSFLNENDKAPPPAAGPDNLAAPPDITNPLATIEPIDIQGGSTLGSLGFNLETYLAEVPGESPEQRIEKLENALIAIHKDLKVMGPVLQRLADVQAGRRGSPLPATPVYENGTGTGAGAAAPAAAAETSTPPKAGAPISLNKQPSLPEATPSPDERPIPKGPRTITSTEGGPSTVTGIRVGEHPDKIRLVFDVTAKTPYSIDLDNMEGLLVVELPQAQWNIPTNKESFGTMPVLKSYRVDSFNDGQGNLFVLQLKGDSDIIYQKTLPALTGGGSRIVMDLKK